MKDISPTGLFYITGAEIGRFFKILLEKWQLKARL